MNFFTAQIRFSQRVRNSNTYLMSIEFKLKFSVSNNYPFPCSDFTIQAVFLDNVRFDNLNDKILLII